MIGRWKRSQARFQEQFNATDTCKERKNNSREVTSWVIEASWNARRDRYHGNAKLTKKVYMHHSQITRAFIQPQVVEVRQGTNRVEVIGLVTLHQEQLSANLKFGNICEILNTMSSSLT